MRTELGELCQWAGDAPSWWLLHLRVAPKLLSLDSSPFSLCAAFIFLGCFWL